MMLLLALLACGTSTPEKAAEVEAKVEAPAAPVERTEAVPVRLVGYGVQLEMDPPFQATRVREGFAKMPDHVIVSTWDIGADGAGQSTDAGLRNVQLLPGTAEEGARLKKGTRELEDGQKVVYMQLGESGTELRFPPGVTEIPELRLSQGPADASWTIQAASHEEPWPADRWLHSSDSAVVGKPYEFTRMPQKPWGHWPEAAPAPAKP